MGISLQLIEEDAGGHMASDGRDISLVLRDLSLSPKPPGYTDSWRDITN